MEIILRLRMDHFADGVGVTRRDTMSEWSARWLREAGKRRVAAVHQTRERVVFAQGSGLIGVAAVTALRAPAGPRDAHVRSRGLTSEVIAGAAFAPA